MRITVFAVSMISCLRQPNSLLPQVSFPNFFSCTIAANVPGVADVFAGAYSRRQKCAEGRSGVLPAKRLHPVIGRCAILKYYLKVIEQRWIWLEHYSYFRYTEYHA